MNFCNARTLKLLCVFAVPLAASGAAHAITGCPLCTVTSNPSSQLGSIADNLTCSFSGTAIVVSGDVTITVAAAPKSGTLASWTIECPLTTSATNATTTTQLDGFIQFTPSNVTPPSTFQTTLGIVESSVEVSSVPVAGSVTSIPLAVSPSTGGATWPNLSTLPSPPFSYVAPATLKQRFDLDGVYTGGPGGTWVVDVPVRTSLNKKADPVPAIPLWGLSALTTLIIGSGMALLRRRQRSSGASGA